MMFLKSVSSIIPLDPETKKTVLDTGAVSIVYPVVKGATQGLLRGSGKIDIYFKQLAKEGPEGKWDVELGRELSEGPLKLLYLYLSDVSRLTASLTFSSVIPVMIREEVSFVGGGGGKGGGVKRRKEEGGRKKGGSRLGHRRDV